MESAARWVRRARYARESIAPDAGHRECDSWQVRCGTRRGGARVIYCREVGVRAPPAGRPVWTSLAICLATVREESSWILRDAVLGEQKTMKTRVSPLTENCALCGGTGWQVVEKAGVSEAKACPFRRTATERIMSRITEARGYLVAGFPA